MEVKKCMKEAKEIISLGLPMLVVRIGEIYDKHDKGGRLTDQEKLIIGLRYSEFLSETNTEIDLYNASIKRDSILEYLEINFNDLIEMCENQLELY